MEASRGYSVVDMSIQIGDLAPDFTLKNQHGEDIQLSGLRGRRVVLVFFPFAFSGVCTSELTELRDSSDLYEGDDTELLALSCDHFFSNRAFADAEGYQFSIVSDFWPHGATCVDYGVFNDEIGAAARSTFIIDREGVLRWTVHNEISEARNINDYRQVLADIG